MDFSKKPLVNDNNENKKQTNESPFKIRQNRKRFFFKFNKIIKYKLNFIFKNHKKRVIQFYFLHYVFFLLGLIVLLPWQSFITTSKVFDFFYFNANFQKIK